MTVCTSSYVGHYQRSMYLAVIPRKRRFSAPTPERRWGAKWSSSWQFLPASLEATIANLAAMAPAYELFTYFRSSCSARVRIAAYFKGIDLQYKFIHLLKNEQQDSEYVDKLNPSKSVPTLVVRESGKEFLIRQSVAILEYFEERHPDLPKLLPPSSDPSSRATVRELVNIVACDIQPVTNLRVLNRIKPLGAAVEEWQQEFMSAGLHAYESIAHCSAGKFSVGDEVTLADVVLSPAVDGALRFKVNMDIYPTVMAIYNELQKLEAFQKGGWKAQPDTPEELRG